MPVVLAILLCTVSVLLNAVAVLWCAVAWIGGCASCFELFLCRLYCDHKRPPLLACKTVNQELEHFERTLPSVREDFLDVAGKR